LEAAADVLNALPVHDLVASSATSLLPNTLSPMPGMATAETPLPFAPPVVDSSLPAVSGTTSVPHVSATDLIFAAAGQVATDGSAWLSGSLNVPDVAVL
jgi:hypothetical protein